MTCIVGMLKDGAVYMSGDHIGTDGYDVEVQKRSKVFRNGEFVVGYTSSFRMGQLLEHVWEPPKKPKDCKDPATFMVRYVVPSLIKLFEENKFMTTVSESDSSKRSINGQAYGGEFLIGYKNRLFKIQSDFAVLECINGYDAIGAGEDFAKGAFCIIQSFIDSGHDLPAATCLKSVLNAVEHHSALVKVNWDEFKVLNTKK